MGSVTGDPICSGAVDQGGRTGSSGGGTGESEGGPGTGARRLEPLARLGLPSRGSGGETGQRVGAFEPGLGQCNRGLGD